MRYLLNILTVLLVAPLVVGGLLWIRSFRVSDDLTWDSAKQEGGKWQHVQRGIYAGKGKLIYYRRPCVTYREAGHPPKTGWDVAHYKPTDPADSFPNYASGSGRFGFWSMKDYWVVGSRALVIPFWAVTGAAVVLCLPALMLARRGWVRAYRRQHGLCVACGYDVRASGKRCPECGFSVSGKKDTGEAPDPQ